MATTTPVAEPLDVDPDAHRERLYVTIALVLAALTAAEVLTFYFPDVLGGEGSPGFIGVLLGLMAVKFFLVASFFMHLRFDKKLLSGVFYSGIVLALLVYMAVLLAFRYFSDDLFVPEGTGLPQVPTAIAPTEPPS